MVIKVGINSFGRIGRVIFRTCCDESEIEVSAINDPAIDLDYMCYLIKFDSTHGKYTGNVSYEGDEIKINEHRVKVFHQKVPSDIPWHEAGVQYVVEASGMFTNLEKASGHLTSESVKKVIVTAPSADAPMLILGVNEDKLQPDVKVISCASSTLYCLAPIVKVLEDSFGVSEGFVTSIHAMTPSLKPLDGLCVRGKHWRDHRSIHQNIIPASTGACKALGKIIPSCKDKFAGLAFRVPIVNVSVLDMSVRLKKNTTISAISQTIEKIKNPSLRNIIHVSKEKAVSSDFIGDRHSCALDIDSSMQISPNFFKLICWYENEYSYSCRVVDTVLFAERQFQARLGLSLTRISHPHTRPLSYKAIRRLQHTECNERNRSLNRVLDNLQSYRPNIKRSSQGLIMKPPIAHGFPFYDVAQPNDAKKRDETIKSYLNQFTKCNCDSLQNKPPTLKMSIDPPMEGNERVRAQDCIKNVEKEINEMLNMTEDLFNKSSRKKTHTSLTLKRVSRDDTEKELITLRENIITKISDTIKKIRNEKNYASNIEISGDQKSLVLDVDDYQDKASVSKHEEDSLNNSNLKLEDSSTKSPIHKVVSSNLTLERSKTLLIQNFKSSCYPCVNNKNLNDLLSQTINKSHITDDLKLQIAKENKALAEGISEQTKNSSIDDRANVHEKDDIDEEVILIISDNLEPVNPLDNSDASETSVKELDNESKRITRSVVTIHASQTGDIIDNEDVNITDSEIVKKVEAGAIKSITQHEPVAAACTVFNEIENIDMESEVRDNKLVESTPPPHPGCSSNIEPRHQCFSNLIDNISEESSICVPYEWECNVTSGSKKTYDTLRNADDIYDKLDSDSVSESESSFQMHEKSSQIINISDLTYSLEDLDRLDKICRVIEISDELSDKLFSPLNNENFQNGSGRKWSFKDLCERIKFDEFCNELFDKSAS